MARRSIVRTLAISFSLAHGVGRSAIRMGTIRLCDPSKSQECKNLYGSTARQSPSPFDCVQTRAEFTSRPRRRLSRVWALVRSILVGVPGLPITIASSVSNQHPLILMSLARNLHKGQSLPGNGFPSGSQEHTAYERCRQLEQHTAWNEFVDDLRSDLPFEEILKSMTPIVAARVLGFGLVHAPNDSGRDALVRDILSCDRTELGVLAYLYVFGLIRVYHNPKGPTPAVTPALSPRLSLEAAAQDPHVLRPSSSNAAVLRSQTLLRDNHRCVFTGIVDAQSYLANIAADVDPGTMALATNVAHIISQSIAENIDGVPPAQQAKFQWARTAGAMIERFGGFNAHEVLGHDNLHNPKNAFTTTHTPHMYFDSLDLWLTPAMDAQGQVVCNTYNVCHADGFGPAIRAAAIKPQVTFRSVVIEGKEIHAPDPRIIELHAACAKIAHMSGAAELLRKFYMDMDSIAVMTQPHAAYKLTRALNTLQSISTAA